MLGAAAVFAPLVAGVVILVLVLVVVPRRRRQVAIEERSYPGLRALLTKTTWARVAGIVLGCPTGWAVTQLPTVWTAHGRGAMLAPVVFGVILVVVVTLGDLLARGDARSPRARTATGVGDENRSIRRVAPRGLSLGVTTVTALLAVVLTAGWLLGTPDTTGDAPGSSLQWESADGVFSGGSGPWPGPFYGSVAIPAVLLLLAVSAVALAVTLSRPRDGSDHEIGRVDSIIRRRAVETVIAAAGLSLSLLTFGLAITAARSLTTLRQGARLNGYDPGVWYDLGGWMGLAAAFVALIVGTACAVSLLVPGPATLRGPRAAVVTGRKVPA